MTTSHPGGTGTIGGHSVARIGYGAMGLGRELPHDDATAVLHRAVELGVNHIDTASFYDDGVVNRRIRDALAPYRDDLLILSKVGARPATGPIPLALAQHPADLRRAVELDLAGLGLDQIPVVNLRRADIGPGLVAEGDQIVDLDDQLAEMIALRDEGKIGAIGISNVGLEILRRALPAGIVCVQRMPTACSTAAMRTNWHCAMNRASRGCRSFPSDRRSRAFRRSPKTLWCNGSPRTSASAAHRSGWPGYSRTRPTPCSSPGPRRSPTSRRTWRQATSCSTSSSSPTSMLSTPIYPRVMASRRSLMKAADVTGSRPETVPMGGSSGVTSASWLAS